MKNVFTTLILMCGAVLALAQTTAQDFTKIDCNGESHHLFAELEAGNVVFMEFAMMPSCQPCINAGKKIEVLKQTVNALHPGQVKWYLMEFSGVYNCAQMQTWKNTHGITSTSFEDGNTEVDYYGGMGMPTLVLLGGADHTVLWKKVGGFVSSDTTVIKNKINAFFQSTGAQEAVESAQFSLFPNPAQNSLQISVENSEVEVKQLEVFSLTGELILVQEWKSGQTNQVDLSTFPAGTYLVQLLIPDRSQVGVKQFIKS